MESRRPQSSVERMEAVLSEWPEFVPHRWRPSQKASSVTWVAVVLLSIYIGADKSGMLEARPESTPQLPEELLLRPSVLDHELLPYDGLVEDAGSIYAPKVPRVLASLSTNASNGSNASAGSNATAGANHSASAGARKGSSASASQGSSHGSSQAVGHKHDALLFLFNAFVLGTVISHLTTMEKFADLQQTVVLFVLGVLYSFLQEGLDVASRTGVLGRSYNMWMDIDPHLILFALLPALLTGDAMTLDTSVARRVAKQCVYLASVGVCVNAFLTAAFLYWYLPYDWSFLLSLTTGAILCATDPVAVVALLKELGAAPTLTVLIQGESLLNDGTAIVLYTISYNMLKGAEYDVADIVMFLVKQAMCAWGLGMLIGGVFLGWIFAASNKFDHHNAMIQVSLTLCCAYWSFIIAEGVFHISGVLATVAAALVLAHAMWPQVVDKESMHTVWHMLEYLGNTLIFFLAGALTGKVMVYIPWGDYIHLLVIYLVVMVIRALMLMASRPILKRLSEDAQDVSIAEVIVMTWGGLRGAVGLALAIQVTVDRADGMVSEMDANRVLFFVGGIAALTLVVNATTCPRVVNSLGVTQLPETKRRLLFMLRRRLLEVCQNKSHPPAVRRSLGFMLAEMEQKIEEEKQRVLKWRSNAIGNKTSQVELSSGGATSDALGGSSPSYPAGTSSSLLTRVLMTVTGRSDKNKIDPDYFADSLRIVMQWQEVKTTFSQIPSDQLQMLKSVGFIEHCKMFQEQEETLLEVLRTEVVEPSMMRAINEAFLNIVRSMYWHAMEHGDLTPGSFEADVLLSSIVHAMNHSEKDLKDWSYVYPCLALMDSTEIDDDCTTSRDSSRLASKDSPQQLSSYSSEADQGQRPRAGTDQSCQSYQSYQSLFPPTDAKNDPSVSMGCSATVTRWKAPRRRSVLEQTKDNFVTRSVNSTPFSVIIMTTILTNSTFIFVEEEIRNSSNDSHLIWLVSDVFFNVIFTVECVMKLIALKHKYFLSSWNLFDFTLVILGLMGNVFNLMTISSNSGANISVLRIARVFRVLRLIRLARLLRFLHVLKEKFVKEETSLEMREHLQKMNILSVFMRSHLQAQSNLLQYFGVTQNAGEHQVTMAVEMARCILQSEISVYQAVLRAVQEEQCLSKGLLEEARQVCESKNIAKELETFISDAHAAGIINATEAHSMVHPLHEHMKSCQKTIHKSVEEGAMLPKTSYMSTDEVLSATIAESSQELGPYSAPTRGVEMPSALQAVVTEISSGALLDLPGAPLQPSPPGCFRLEPLGAADLCVNTLTSSDIGNHA